MQHQTELRLQYQELYIHPKVQDIVEIDLGVITAMIKGTSEDLLTGQIPGLQIQSAAGEIVHTIGFVWAPPHLVARAELVKVVSVGLGRQSEAANDLDELELDVQEDLPLSSSRGAACDCYTDEEEQDDWDAKDFRRGSRVNRAYSDMYVNKNKRGYVKRKDKGQRKKKNRNFMNGSNSDSKSAKSKSRSISTHRSTKLKSHGGMKKCSELLWQVKEMTAHSE